MARWLVVKDNTGLIKDTFLNGKSGTAALDSALPVHMIGKVRRRREWEEPDFILQKLVKRVGVLEGGLICGYKYHKPTITREARS